MGRGVLYAGWIQVCVCVHVCVHACVHACVCVFCKRLIFKTNVYVEIVIVKYFEPTFFFWGKCHLKKRCSFIIIKQVKSAVGIDIDCGNQLSVCGWG